MADNGGRALLLALVGGISFFVSAIAFAFLVIIYLILRP
jgi:hypothetical protein